MSLVLEALKKLEREKGRDDRGFLVMAAAPWPRPASRRWPLWVAAGVAAGAAAAVLVLRASPPVALPSMPAAATHAGSGAIVPAPAPAAGTAMRERAAASAPNERASRPPLAPAVPPRAGAGAAPAPEAGVQGEAPSDPAHGLRLQAISARDGQPIAMVSDRLVRVGDEFDGVRVLAIRDAEVDVEVRGRRATLRF